MFRVQSELNVALARWLPLKGYLDSTSATCVALRKVGGFGFDSLTSSLSAGRVGVRTPFLASNPMGQGHAPGSDAESEPNRSPNRIRTRERQSEPNPAAGARKSNRIRFLGPRNEPNSNFGFGTESESEPRQRESSVGTY